MNNDGHRLVLPASHLDQTWHESQRMNRADLRLIVEAVNYYDAFRELEAAVRKYVEDEWSAWNNQDGHGWPEVRAALDAISKAQESV